MIDLYTETKSVMMMSWPRPDLTTSRADRCRHWEEDRKSSVSHVGVSEVWAVGCAATTPHAALPRQPSPAGDRHWLAHV